MESSFHLARDNHPISLSQTFILPEENRPNLSQVISTLSSIPVIDLSNIDDHGNGNNHSMVVHKISHACEEYGFFQITNHGISPDLCKTTMKVIDDFFKMPSQERAQFLTNDRTKLVKLMNYHLKAKDNENVTLMWSEIFNHPWDSNGNFAAFLPGNPPKYREVFVEYAKEMNKLMKRLLGLISQGLGLEKDCLESKQGQNPHRKAQLNFYPPCPEPELTLGLAIHTDLNALTVLMQSEDVLSNGRYKSVHHRAVTNKTRPRISLAMFYGPNKDTVIGPVDNLVDKEHPRLYRSYKYSEFFEEFIRQEGTRRMVTQVFELP